jgi:hypothetical protein
VRISARRSAVAGLLGAVAAVAFIFNAGCNRADDQRAEEPPSEPSSESRPTPEPLAASKPAPGPASTPKPGKKPMSQPEMTWKLERTAKAIVLSYEVRNTLGESIWICDKIVIAKGRDDYATTDLPIVKNLRGEASTIQIALGPISSDRPAVQMLSPTYRLLEAGKSHSDKREIPLPLRSFHPLGGADPIDQSATNVRFKLFYFKKEPAWKDLPSKSGPSIKVPEAPLVLILESVQPMP